MGGVEIVDWGDSDGEGLKMGDLVQPGSKKLNIDPTNRTNEFNEYDRKLWAMQCTLDHSVMINEYGSNMFKSKFDPLQAIEAKIAIQSGSATDWVMNKDTIQLGEQEHKTPREQEEGQETTSPSPIRGTQEGPTIDISSQEEEGARDNEQANTKEQMTQQEVDEAGED